MPGVTALISSLLPGSDHITALLFLAIGLITATILFYTLVGGMQAVIWTDVIQLMGQISYLCNAISAPAPNPMHAALLLVAA